jgi:hypothetical protein
MKDKSGGDHSGKGDVEAVETWQNREVDGFWRKWVEGEGV